MTPNPRALRALSIQQPWAWLIVHGHKPVENRGWYGHHRGALLIHAGMRTDKDGDAWVRATFPEIALPPLYQLDVGGIVGRVTMTDCVMAHPSRWFFGPHGFVFREASPLPFRRCRGQLGFFPVDGMMA